MKKRLPIGFLTATLAVGVPIVGLTIWCATETAALSFVDAPCQAPLQRCQVTRRFGHVVNIHVWLARGTHLSDVVDVGLFDGFRGTRTLEEARQQHGEPDSVRQDPYYLLSAHCYHQPRAIMCFVSVPGSYGPPSWVRVAYPVDQTTGSIIPKESLAKQIIEQIPEDRKIEVHITADAGDEDHVIRLFMTKTNIEHVTL